MPSNEILTYDQYGEIERAGLVLPHVIEVVTDEQHLTFFGSDHTNNPAHPQFAELESRWATFCAEVANPIALVEGYSDELPEDATVDKTASIVAGGESQCMVYLARSSNVPVRSPEPDKIWLATQLADQFGKDKMALYYFVLQLSWWNRLTEVPDIRARVGGLLEYLQQTYPSEEVDFSIEGMQELHTKIFGRPLDLYNHTHLNDITTPSRTDFVTNLISRRSGELRDENILEEIENYWAGGYSPFAVYGGAHAVRLEPALRKLGK